MCQSQLLLPLRRMANKKSIPPSARTKKPSKVPLAPTKGTPKAPAAIEQADGSPKPVNTKASASPAPSDGSRASKGSPNTNSVRTYDIPDYRLEKPEFRIFMSGEGSNCEYRIEGDLSAAAPPIRESKYLSREQCDRDLSLDAAEPPHGSGAGESLQAGQGGRRRVLRPGTGGLLVRLGVRARARTTGSGR